MQTELLLATLATMILGTVLLLTALLVSYRNYSRTGASQCKKALESARKRLERKKAATTERKAKLTAELTQLEERMVGAIINKILKALPIQEVINAPGIGKEGARLLGRHGFSTVHDLKRGLRRIPSIRGFGAGRMSNLKTWMLGIERRLKRRIDQDPSFEVEIRQQFTQPIESLRQKLNDLETELTIAREGLEVVQEELKRYRQVRFAAYVTGRLSVTRDELEQPSRKPVGFGGLTTLAGAERKELPDGLVDAFRSEKDLKRHLRTDFQDMLPRDFEEFVAELLRMLGYSKVRLTTHTQDMGADIECIDEEGRHTIVEVKRYRSGNNVGNQQIRSLVGAMSYFGADRALFVTTSDYTPDARTQAEASPSTELWSGDDLRQRSLQAYPNQDSFTEVTSALESWMDAEVIFRLEEADTGLPALVCSEGLAMIRDDEMVKCPWGSTVLVTRGVNWVKTEWPGVREVTLRTVTPSAVADTIQEKAMIRKESVRREFRERFKRIDREYGNSYLWSSCGTSEEGVVPIHLYPELLVWADRDGTHELKLRDVLFAVAGDDRTLALGLEGGALRLPAIDPRVAADWVSVSAATRRIAWVESNAEGRVRHVSFWGSVVGAVGIVSCCASLAMAGMLVEEGVGASRASVAGTPSVVTRKSISTPALLSATTVRPTVTLTDTPQPTDEPVSTVDVSDCTVGAVFQKDVTVPDDTRIEAGQAFTKTWRIRNTGTCEWGPGYRLAYIEGDEMGAPDAVAVPHTAQGESADISVPLEAPTKSGRYRAYWQMCVNEECLGEQVYVQIVVEHSTPTPSPTPTRSPAMIEEERYVIEVAGIWNSYKLTLERYSKLNDDLANDVRLVSDAAWRDEQEANLDRMRDLSDDIRALDPPSQYGVCQDYLLEVADETDEAVELYIQGVNQMNADRMNEANGRFVMAIDKWEEAVLCLENSPSVPNY